MNKTSYRLCQRSFKTDTISQHIMKPPVWSGVLDKPRLSVEHPVHYTFIKLTQTILSFIIQYILHLELLTWKGEKLVITFKTKLGKICLGKVPVDETSLWWVLYK